jgi:hypothetical protein
MHYEFPQSFHITLWKYVGYWFHKHTVGVCQQSWAQFYHIHAFISKIGCTTSFTLEHMEQIGWDWKAQNICTSVYSKGEQRTLTNICWLMALFFLLVFSSLGIYRGTKCCVLSFSSSTNGRDVNSESTNCLLETQVKVSNRPNLEMREAQQNEL